MRVRNAISLIRGAYLFLGLNQKTSLKGENIVEKVLSSDYMRKSWKQVKENKGVAGVDGMSIMKFPEFVRTKLNNIRKQLIKWNYKPPLVKRVEIPKPDGSKRPFGIPSVTDRVI